MFVQVLAFRVRLPQSAAALGFLESGGDGRRSVLSPQEQKQVTVECLHSRYWLHQVTVQQIVRWLGVGLPGVDAAQRFLAELVGRRALALGGDRPFQAGVLSAPLPVVLAGDDRVALVVDEGVVCS